MGGSVFFFVESKSFEFSVEEGGMFYQLRIYERGRDSLRSIFMGRGSAKRLLFYVEELISGQSSGQFARSCREGDKCFILQLGSNSHGAFLLISELTHGRRKGSIVVPEGKTGSGWRGFGLHLRKVLDPESLAPKQAITGIFTDASKSFASVVAGKRNNNEGGGHKGKKKNVLIQNTNPEQPRVKSLSGSSRNNSEESILGQREPPGVKILSESSRVNRVTCKDSTLGQRDQIGAKILSTIDGIEDKGIKAELTLDMLFRLERGLDGNWALVWSEVKEVGPKVVQPKKPTIQNLQKVNTSGPFKYVKPKPVWRPRQSQSLANPVHRQWGNIELVALGARESRVLPSGQVVASLSVDGSSLMSIGYSGDQKRVGVKV